MTNEETPRSRGVWGWIAAAGLAIAKFFKPLLLLLANFKTVFSMLAFFGVYWAQHGWAWALGFVLCIFVHEMGHVLTLRKFGVEATAPMFIPFIGAFVQIKGELHSDIENARAGTAGPEFGLYATLAAYALYLATGAEVLKAIGHTSAFINLFNLVPVWQLDGSRGVASLSQNQRLMLMGLAGLLAFHFSQGMLWIIAVVMLIRGIKQSPPERHDTTGFLIYAGLLVALAWLASPMNSI